MKKAVARAGLGNSTADLHDFARGKNHSHCQHVIARGAILNSTHAASVGTYVAAQRTGFLAGIRGIHKVMLKRICCQIAQANARLNANEQVVHVVLEDFIHVHSAQYDATLQRGAAANQASARTTNRDGNLVLVAQLHDGSNLFSVAGEANGLGHLGAVNGHFVVRVIFADVFANVAIFLADDSLELADQFGSEFVVLSHANFSLLWTLDNTGLPR